MLADATRAESCCATTGYYPFMRKNLVRFNRLAALPGGKRLFTLTVCRAAPYFASIKPHIEALDVGYARASMAKRRKVLNHIGSVHAIAMCNLAEIVAGLMTDVSIPDGARWLPTGMRVEYLTKATTDLVAVANGSAIDWSQPGFIEVPVAITDSADTVVFRAYITMNVKLD